MLHGAQLDAERRGREEVGQHGAAAGVRGEGVHIKPVEERVEAACDPQFQRAMVVGGHPVHPPRRLDIHEHSDGRVGGTLELGPPGVRLRAVAAPGDDRLVL